MWPKVRGAFGCLCCLASVGSLVASIPFFLAAAPDLDVATNLSPEAFQPFDHACAILSVRRCWVTTPAEKRPSVPEEERELQLCCWHPGSAGAAPRVRR